MKTILIVDDSLFTRTIHQQIFESAGYQTLTAQNGKEALSVYQSRQPDLVTLDLLMPDMDGMETLGRLREIDPDAKIIVCSTDKQQYRRQTAKSLGAVGFFAKPVDPDKLLPRVADILGDE